MNKKQLAITLPLILFLRTGMFGALLTMHMRSSLRRSKNAAEGGGPYLRTSHNLLGGVLAG